VGQRHPLRQQPCLAVNAGRGDYHDFSHNELHTWDSATFTPVDNKKHDYVISDAVYGSEDVDHIIIKIDAFENGSWRTKGTAVEYRPQDCTSDFPPI
jgi:hypothetical protein